MCLPSLVPSKPNSSLPAGSSAKQNESSAVSTCRMPPERESRPASLLLSTPQLLLDPVEGLHTHTGRHQALSASQYHQQEQQSYKGGAEGPQRKRFPLPSFPHLHCTLPPCNLPPANLSLSTQAHAIFVALKFAYAGATAGCQLAGKHHAA